MIPVYCKGTKIYNEFSESMRSSFFDLKKEKFLHNIDTFYYTVFLYNDFSRNSDDVYVKAFRKYFDEVKVDFDTVEELDIPGCHEQLNIVPGCFSRYYLNHIECPDSFDIFICPFAPNEDTGQIIVQLRSNFIWRYGIYEAFNKSYDCIEKICNHFTFFIAKVQENRVDFCWHTNYFDNPEQYFLVDSFVRSKVTRFKDINAHYDLKGHSSYEYDYMSLGHRGGSCFLRIYLKTKEVVQMGYKAQFFYIWKLHNLINEYDFWVLSRAYESGDWYKLDFYRLQFYLEYGKDEVTKQHIKELLNAENPNAKLIYEMAELVVPRVTKVINIEFQTSHRSTRTYVLVDTKRNDGPTKRIYDFLDNRALIADYLTHDTFRMVDPSTHSKKSKADYNYMWKRLRSTKMIDTKRIADNINLIREYSSNLDKENIKRRLNNSLVTYGLYSNGNNDNDVMQDIFSYVSTLNDNDVERMKRYKQKKNKQLKVGMTKKIDIDKAKYVVMEKKTGFIYGGDVDVFND